MRPSKSEAAFLCSSKSCNEWLSGIRQAGLADILIAIRSFTVLQRAREEKPKLQAILFCQINEATPAAK